MTYYEIENVKRVEQIGQFLCWAACISMIYRIVLDEKIDQCELASLLSEDESDCCSQDINSIKPNCNIPCRANLLPLFFLNSQIHFESLGTTIPNKVETLNHLQEGPYMIGLEDFDDIENGHLILITGIIYDDYNTYYKIVDPGSYASEGWISKSELANYSSHGEWRYTWRFSKIN